VIVADQLFSFVFSFFYFEAAEMDGAPERMGRPTFVTCFAAAAAAAAAAAGSCSSSVVVFLVLFSAVGRSELMAMGGAGGRAQGYSYCRH